MDATFAAAGLSDRPRRLNYPLFDRLTRKFGAETISEKAALAGVHISTLYRLKHGTITPTRSALTISTRLGVTVNRLFPVVADENEAA